MKLITRRQSRPEISIIIVAWRARDELSECLKWITSSNGIDIKKGIEIIIILNDVCLNDEYLVEEYKEATFIVNKMNMGFGYASNQAAHKATGKWLFFINPDVRGDKNVIFQTLKKCENLGEETVIGPLIRNRENQVNDLPLKFPTLTSTISDLPIISKLYPVSIGKSYCLNRAPKTTIEVDWILGAFMGVSKTAFEKIGGFDERFFLFSEDIDFCLRAKKEGFKIFICDSPEVFHYGGASTQEVLGLREVVLWDSTIKYFDKHHGICYGLVVRVSIIVAFFIKILTSLLTGRFTTTSMQQVSISRSILKIAMGARKGVISKIIPQ